MPQGVLATGGPMARTVDDVILALRALWAPGSPLFELDRVPPIPFNEAVLSDSRPLRVGVCTTEGHVYPAPCPSAVRAVEQAAAALAARGHTVVPFSPDAPDVCLCGPRVRGRDLFFSTPERIARARTCV